MTSTASSIKKDIQKLQRAIVDGLEAVKAQDIQVFDTEALSPLFERVIVASGTSNRQTRALAASVRDAVREAGFAKPRIEGEENGEWIIVDCGAAVVHVMQPAIRQYYHLEDLWGEHPIRLKFGAPKPVAATPKPKVVKSKKSPSEKKAAAKKIAAKKRGSQRPVPIKIDVKKTTTRPVATKQTAAKKIATKQTATKQSVAKKVAVKAVNKKTISPKTKSR